MSLLPHPAGAARAQRGRLLTWLPLGALVAISVGAVLVDAFGSGLEPGTLDALAAALTVACLITSVGTLVARTVSVRSERLPWALVAFAAASWGLASLSYALWGRDARGTTLQVIDLGFLAFYPAMSLALWLMVRGRVVHFFRASWLDVLIGFAGATAIGLAVAVEWIVPTGAGHAAVAGNAKYPFLDAVLLVQILAGLLLTGGRAGRAWTLLAAGLALFAIADTAYVAMLLRDADNAYVVAPLWVGGLQLLAAASLRVPRGASVPVHSSPVATLALPLGFAVLMICFLVAAAFIEVPPASAVLAGISLALVIARTALTFRENLELSETQHLALTDDLTGLANRRHLVSALDHVASSRQDRSRSGLLICDLDGFKFINDTLGHHAGDQILAEIGRRLRGLDGFHLIARLGGDEFAAIVPTPAAEASLRTAAHRWQRVFAEPVMIDGIALQVTGSVGGALAADDLTAGELLRHADVAMYTAKEDERPFEIYRPERDDHSPAQLRLAGELRTGLRDGQLKIHYQPKVQVSTGLLCGVEALVRWEHPRHGLIPPEQMLSIAQRAGLMREVTSKVLDAALAQLATWHAAGSNLTMAVNLSISDLHDMDLPTEVGQLLRRHGVRGDRLVLEVTEDLVMARPERVADVVGGLRRLGIAIALDDFGAGRSSLAYVRRLQVAELKIDKQFMMRVERDADARAIVRGAVELAHELGLRVVAEGVETPVGLQLLAETGCEEAQGYLISKPVPADQIDLGLRLPVNLPAPASAGLEAA